MVELANVTFETAALPQGWVEERHECCFERGALRSGRVAALKFPLPGQAWGRLSVEAEIDTGHRRSWHDLF